ncbi:MAG: hypothetical protein U0163_00565 [Gemmatimonadaceae bacterium]
MFANRSVRASLAVVMLMGPALGLAQQQPHEIKLTPFVGVYAPTTKVAKMDMTVEGTSFAASITQKTSFAFGATGSYWWTRRVGLELGGAYAMSDATGTFRTAGGAFDPSAMSQSERARVLFGSARLMFGILPLGEDAQLRLGMGPAIVNRGGKAYRAEADGKFQGLTDVGGVVSLCTRIPMTELLAIRIRAEDYMYESQLKVRTIGGDASGTFAFDRRFQHDFLVSAGLQLGFRR